MQKENKSIKIKEKEEVVATAEVTSLPTYAITYNKLKALFNSDPQLIISPIDDEKQSVTISSSDYHKLEALSKMLKPVVGELTINLEYSGNKNEYARTIDDAFRGNTHFDNVRVTEEAHTGNKHVITTFKDETVQYDADSRFVPNGYETTLAETLVQEFFNEEYLRSVYITKQKDNTVYHLSGSISWNPSSTVSLLSTDSVKSYITTNEISAKN